MRRIEPYRSISSRAHSSDARYGNVDADDVESIEIRQIRTTSKVPVVPLFDDQAVIKKQEWSEIKTIAEEIARRKQSPTETANSMVLEVRTSLLDLHNQQVEFQERHQQLFERQKQVDQHAQASRTYWGEQQYWNQSLYAEQPRENAMAHQFADVIQAQSAEQQRQDAR